jgi:hypothetical protein
MNIETKYNIGDLVYFIRTISIPTIDKCRTCLGEGVLVRKDNSEIQCPVCNGEKTYSDGDSGIFEEKVFEGNISHIEVTIDNRCNMEHTIEIDILYYIENKDQEWEYVRYDSFYQEDLYDTFYEAQKNIKKLSESFILPLEKISYEDFKYLKECGMLWEFYPDAPEKWEEIHRG